MVCDEVFEVMRGVEEVLWGGAVDGEGEVHGDVEGVVGVGVEVVVGDELGEGGVVSEDCLALARALLGCGEGELWAGGAAADDGIHYGVCLCGCCCWWWWWAWVLVWQCGVVFVLHVG